LPDPAEFRRKVGEFEKLDLNSTERRTGFIQYAPDVLPKGFPAIWGQHKEQIAAMSHRKCVYCEGPLNAPAEAHIEHFKPKSLFPSLAYCWTNYFLGCPGCNVAKLDKWPERGSYIRPDRGNPARHFTFSEDGRIHAARPGGIAERMIGDFGLNRKWLVDERKGLIETMLRIQEALKEVRRMSEALAQEMAQKQLAVWSEPAQAYSTALIECFRRAWEKILSEEQVGSLHPK
jgi:uncharacterized protein (TIGR02646 family)